MIDIFPVGTINTSLFVAPVDEQVSGALREPRQGDQLDEARNGVTGQEILPTLLTAQNLPVNNPQSGVNVVLVLAKKKKRKTHVCVPESNHLSQHNTEGREHRWWQRDGPSQVLRGAFSKVHGLNVHADPCKTQQILPLKG